MDGVDTPKYPRKMFLRNTPLWRMVFCPDEESALDSDWSHQPLAYRSHSIFTTKCICGETLESKTHEVTCAACGKQAIMEWPHRQEVIREGAD